VDNLGFPGLVRQHDANPARRAPGQRNSRRAICGTVLHYDSQQAATSLERVQARNSRPNIDNDRNIT